MNKFGIAVALVAVMVGLVAISAVSGDPAPKRGHEESFEQESGELESRPRPEPAKGHHKSQVRGRREHQPHGGVPPRKPEHKPAPKRHPPPRKPGHHYPPRPRPGYCRHEAPEYETGRGQEFEGEEFGQGEEQQQQQQQFRGEEFGRGQEGEGEEFGRGEEQQQQQQQQQFTFQRHGGGEQGRRSGNGGGSFKGAGAFGGFKKEKEFDGGVRGVAKNSNRNQFAKQKTFVGGEQKAVGAGASNRDVNTVEGVHKHKNVNNDRLVVKETQRGTEDTDAFRGQSERNEEGHFGASDTKVFGAQAGESGSSEQENEREFEGDVHKKESVGAAGGAGVFGGRF